MTKTDIADIIHTGLQFPGLVYNLEARERPLIPIANQKEWLKPARRPKCAIFQFLNFWGERGGEGVEIIHHDCNLETNRMEHQTSHPPENKDKTRESQNLPFIWGRWGGAGVNDKFLSVLSENSSSQG